VIVAGLTGVVPSVADTLQADTTPGPGVVDVPAEQSTTMVGVGAAVTVTVVDAVALCAPFVAVTVAVAVPGVEYPGQVRVFDALVAGPSPSPQSIVYNVAAAAPFVAVAVAVSVVDVNAATEAGDAASVTAKVGGGGGGVAVTCASVDADPEWPAASCTMTVA